MKKIVLGIGVVGILAAAYVWFFVYNKSHRDHHSEDEVFNGNVIELREQFFTGDGSIDSSLIDQMVVIHGEVTEMESNSYILDEACLIHLHESVTINPDSSYLTFKGRLHGVQEDIIYGELISIDHAIPQ